MKTFHISGSNVRVSPQNTEYPVPIEITNIDDLKQAARYDHTCGQFRGNKLNTENFLTADGIVMDCDNDHSDNPEDWLTPEKLHALLTDVPFCWIYSKSHMKIKAGDKDPVTGKVREYSARPRFHVYFPLELPIKDAASVRALKERLLQAIPEFDEGAKDAARKIYGVEYPDGGAYEGTTPIDVFWNCGGLHTALKAREKTKAASAVSGTPTEANEDVIKFGERNSTLFTTALSLLAKYPADVAGEKYNEAVKRCEPPLPVSESNKVWRNALKISKGWEDKDKTQARKGKTPLNPAIVEKALQACNIKVQFDVYKRRAVVSDLPLDSDLLPDSYKNANAVTRAQMNEGMLPLFMIAYLKKENYSFKDTYLYDCLGQLALANTVNPFIDRIKAAEWDGKDRITETFEALGYSPDSPYYMYFVKWLWQVISISQNDDGALANEFCLVLQGAQGCGKTSFFRKLAMASDFFKEGASIDTNKKDTLIEATAVPITELGELDATLGREQSALKAFMNRPIDEYRAPYGKMSIRYPRRTTFCATVNPAEFLRDNTGSRRFVVIPVTEMKIEFILNEMTPDYCQQLWRQVYDSYYKAKGRSGFYLAKEERAFSEQKNINSAVQLDGEIELWDQLEWNSDPMFWEWKTNSEIIKMLDIKLSAQKMGRALTAVMMKDNRVRKKVTMTVKLYLLPPKKSKYELY